MAAPVLTEAEQKKALSRKKKKSIRKVLSLPSVLRVKFHVISDKEEEKFSKILHRLLSSARILNEQSNLNKKNEKVTTVTESEEKKKARNKRNQLSLGVNETYKNLKKNLLSAVLLAADIQPEFLVHHLNLLCNHNNLPYLHITKLREITKISLGFPCIVLGFKKNFNFFSEAVIKIQSLVQTYVNDCNNENETDSSESEEILLSSDTSKSEVKTEVTPFTYLYRTSVKKRIFIPENQENCNNEAKKNEIKSIKTIETNFISFGKENEETREADINMFGGISQHLIKKKKKRKIQDIKVIDTSESEDEDLEMPKKKPKFNWVIDKVGEKSKLKYTSPNLIKVYSNPNRVKKKNK